MVTASIWDCGPITCSNAARNSLARRPWVTSTSPIILLRRAAGRHEPRRVGPTSPKASEASGFARSRGGNIIVALHTNGKYAARKPGDDRAATGAALRIG
ncbi:hypothetical protein GCM10017653_33990 [Ancylobacter defluvii]|uniref:Uncharacterized protein n=1 Tax=Ancylobacter defluvii TaxID=1282440 RepID=A0A9W6NB95_9HYPH|nr:hypothetical protein GCM10017653_33990 [Ancylobacter defluvii]